jgi:DNA polymerase III epsilon subunit-like protein
MKNFLFFDTETTGLPTDYKASPGPSWPQIVTISWILSDGNNSQFSNFLVKPDGWLITKEAENIHGISQIHAEQNGIPLKLVLKEFLKIYNNCDAIIAHNLSFDLNVIKSSFLSQNLPVYLSKKAFCTMELSTNICCLPPKFDYQKSYKWPSLQELYFYLFSKKFENAHNSETDTLICLECFFELKKRELIKV